MIYQHKKSSHSQETTQKIVPSFSAAAASSGAQKPKIVPSFSQFKPENIVPSFSQNRPEKIVPSFSQNKPAGKIVPSFPKPKPKVGASFPKPKAKGLFTF